MADNETVVQRGGNWFTRSFGAGYPDPKDIIDLLAKRLSGGTASG